MLRFDPFRDLDRLTEPARSARSIMAFDAIRDDDQVTIFFDIPGVNADDLEVDIEKNELTIRAERRWEAGDQRIIASERPQGSFSRQLLLGDNLDTDRLEASLADGVLTVRIPVDDRSKQRRVKVASGQGTNSAIDTTGSERKGGTEIGAAENGEADNRETKTAGDGQGNKKTSAQEEQGTKKG